MAYIHCVTGGSGGGIPPQLQSDMDSVLNKKLGTSTTYPSTDWAKEVNLMGLLPEKTVSGSVASFADGADDVPIKTATFDIAPTLDGVSEVNVVRTGKNLFDGSKVTTTHTNNWGITWENGSLTIQHKNSYTSGTPVYNLNLPNGTYIFSFVGDNNYTALNKDGSYNKMLNNGTSFDIEEGHTYSITISAPANDSKTFSNIQLEIGSSATTYAPYTAPETRTISLGQTVYGGSVTVDEDGECSVKSYNIWDEETIAGYFDTVGAWITSSTNLSSKNPIFVLPNTQYYIKVPAGASLFVTYWKTSVTSGESHTTEFISRSASNVGNTIITTPSNCHALHFNLGAGYGTTYNDDIAINSPSTVTEYNPYLAESTLTPITPITSALGVNNIWCDTGDVESLTYRTPEVIPIPCLSSGGNQAITLPIYDDGGYTFKFKLMVFAPQNNTLILGGYWDAGCLLFHTYKVSNNYVLYYYPSNTPVSAPIKFGQWMDIELAPSYMKVDGVMYQGTAASRYHNQTRLFAYDNAYGSSIALSEIEVYNSSNVKVLDLVPTKNSSGQGIFHDTVNNTDYSSTQQPCGYIEL